MNIYHYITRNTLSRTLSQHFTHKDGKPFSVFYLQNNPPIWSEINSLFFEKEGYSRKTSSKNIPAIAETLHLIPKE